MSSLMTRARGFPAPQAAGGAAGGFPSLTAPCGQNAGPPPAPSRPLPHRRPRDPGCGNAIECGNCTPGLVCSVDGTSCIEDPNICKPITSVRSRAPPLVMRALDRSRVPRASGGCHSPRTRSGLRAAARQATGACAAAVLWGLEHEQAAGTVGRYIHHPATHPLRPTYPATPRSALQSAGHSPTAAAAPCGEWRAAACGASGQPRHALAAASAGAAAHGSTSSRPCSKPTLHMQHAQHTRVLILGAMPAPLPRLIQVRVVPRRRDVQRRRVCSQALHQAGLLMQHDCRMLRVRPGARRATLVAPSQWARQMARASWTSGRGVYIPALRTAAGGGQIESSP